MPPKAKEVPQVVELKPDTNPWGAFINVLVPSAVLELDVPPPKPAEEEPKPKTPAGKTKGAPPPPPPPAEPLPPTIPKTHFTLTYTDAFAPVAGKSSQPDAGQEDKAGAKVQQLTFSYEPLAFRWDTGLAALEQLINANVLLKLHDSVTNNVLASMRLDLLPFAMGKQAFELPAAELAPADVAAEGVLKLLSGSIPKIQLSLTMREAPPPVEVAAADAAEAPAAAADSSEAAVLPEPQPYRYVSEAEVAEGANVVELLLGPLDPVTPNLQTVIDTVLGKDGQQGKVTFSAGVALPSPGPTLLLPGKLVAGKGVTFGDGPRRFLLSADGAEALRVHLEAGRGLAVEVARYVTSANDAHADVAWDAWHGAAALPDTQSLLVEGARQLPTGSPDGGPAAALLAWDASAFGPTCLPPKHEPTPGAKPGKPLEADLAAVPSVWQQLGTGIGQLHFRLVNPLVPTWCAPETPGRTVPDLVPTRDLHPPPPPSTAADDVRAAVSEAVKILAAAFREAPQEDAAAAAASDAPVPQRHRRLIFELNRSGQYEVVLSSLKAPLQRLVREELSASGRMQPVEMGPLYSRLYAHLLNLVHLQLTQETGSTPAGFGPGGPGPAASGAKRQAPGPEEAARLLVLARQYEEAGRWMLRGGGKAAVSHALRQRGGVYLARAEALHQLRLLDGDSVQTWQAHAEFCLRCGQRGRALVSTRNALEIDPTYAPALLLLAGLQLEAFLSSSTVPQTPLASISARAEAGSEAAGAAVEGGAEAARQLLDEALVAGHALLAASDEQGQGLAWALLALVYQSMPGTEGACRRNLPWASCRQVLSLRERQGLDGLPAAAAVDANGFFQLWRVLVQMQLPAAATAAQAAVPLLQRSAAALGDDAEAARLETTLLCRSPADGTGEGDLTLAEAATTARRLVRRAGAVPAAAAPALLLQAEVAWRRGSLDEVVTYCQRAQGALRYACPLEVHLRLAEALMLLGQPQYAADALAAAAAPPDGGDGGSDGAEGAAAALRSSPLLWLLLGRACLAAGDADGADAALTESNLLDPELPELWGLLALLAARQARWRDVLHALSRGRSVGLTDAEALSAVAGEYESVGRWEEAVGVLQWAVRAAGEQGAAGLGLELQRRLARAHAALGNARDARAVVDAAAQAAAAEAQAQAQAQAQLQAAADKAAAAAAAAEVVGDESAGQEAGGVEPKGSDADAVAAVAAARAEAEAAAAGEGVRHVLLEELHLWRDALPVDAPMGVDELVSAAEAEGQAVQADGGALSGDGQAWGPDAPADGFASEQSGYAPIAAPS